MKSKLIIIVILVLGLKVDLKAQKRVPHGQYTSTVAFNWVDSVVKYKEIAMYYLLKSDSGRYEANCRLWDYYQLKSDSVQLNTRLAKDSIALVRKYNIKLE